MRGMVAGVKDTKKYFLSGSSMLGEEKDGS